MTLRIQQLGVAFVVFLASFAIAASVSAADTVNSALYVDIDDDGQIDQVNWNMDENVTGCTYEAEDWTVNTAGSINVSITGLDCSGSILQIEVSADEDETGGAIDPVISYNNTDADDSVTLTSGAMTAKASQTATDSASPIIASSSPSSGDNNVSRSGDITITFTEEMDTSATEAAVTLEPDAGTITYAWSSGDTVLTLDPANNLSPGWTYTVTVSTAAEATAGPDAFDNLESESQWSFSVQGSSSSSTSDSDSSSGTTSTEPTVSFSEPDAGEELDGGELKIVSWEAAAGTGVTYMSLEYTTDDGENYTEIETFLDADDEEYSWMVPNIDAESAYLRARLYNSTKAQIGTTNSETFSIDFQDEDEFDVIDEDEDGDESEDNNDDSSSEATSPISGISAGDVVKSESGSAVYFITEDYARRVFIDAQSYFTWFDSFDEVEVVSDDEISEFPLEGLMLPKAGSVLVKIQTDARVYALSDNGDGTMLHEIESEDVAISLFGDDWADYVIDVDVAFFGYFESGGSIESETDADTLGVSTDMDEMIKRIDLN